MEDLTAYVMELCTTILTTIVTVGIPAVTGLFVHKANKRWNLNISAEQQAQIEHLAVQSVMTASQTFDRGQHAEKRKKAVDKLIEDAKTLGKSLGEESARDYVEAAINELKRQRGALPQTADAA